MSDGERSPKRPRLEGYSPASPPLTLETKPFVAQPQTPPPSVHMSPSWQAQSLATEQRTSSGGPGSVTFPTPPSTSSFPVGPGRTLSGEEGAESASHTPTADAEQRRDGDGDGDGDAEMGDGSEAVAEAGRTSEDAEHRRTDHERNDDEAMDTLPDLPPAPLLYKLRTERECTLRSPCVAVLC
jgi:hypothetical protein